MVFLPEKKRGPRATGEGSVSGARFFWPFFVDWSLFESMMLYDIAAFPPVDFRVQAAFFFRKGWKVIILKFNSLESHLYLFSYLQKNSFSRSCQIVAISCKRSLCVGVLSVRWLHWSASQVTRTSENMIVTLQQVGCTWNRQLASEMISPATCGGMMCTTVQLTSWKALPQTARRISEKKKE